VKIGTDNLYAINAFMVAIVLFCDIAGVNFRCFPVITARGQTDLLRERGSLLSYLEFAK